MSPTRSWVRPALLTMVLMLSRPAAAPAQLAYSFTIIADTTTSSQFSDFGVPTINPLGEVVFAARLRAGGSGIFRFGGVPQSVAPVYQDGADRLLFDVNGRFGYPAIDGTGRVLFQLGDVVYAGIPGGGLSIVADPSSPVPPISFNPNAHTCERPRLIGRSVALAGAVVACGSTGGVYLANGGSLQRITDADSPVRIAPEGPAEVNADGTIGALGWKPGARGFPVVAFVRSSSAGTTVLLDSEIHTDIFILPTSTGVAINDSGTVAFNAYWDLGPSAGFTIFEIDTPGQPINVTDPRTVYRAAVWPSMNNPGEIAFVDDFRRGLFTGPDPAFDKVLGLGDGLPAYPTASVGFVSFQHPGINDAGQLVFIAHMNDLATGQGFLAIVRADPPTNLPPVVTNPGAVSTAEGSPVALQIAAVDPDGDYPLTYFSSAPTALPPGTIAGPPPGVSAIDQNGRFVGTPDVGTAGNTYAITVTVRDVRGLVSVPETFTWTITGPAPDPRTALTANFVLADETIRLAWQNAMPDTADTIEVQYAEGPCGGSGFSHLVTLAAGTASYDWVHGFPGRSYRFRVVGISAAGVRSTPSNVACVTVGTNEISNVLVTALSESTATITWTTLMPSRSVPTLTPEPAGLVANLVAAADQKTFALSLSGLAPQTSYSLRIFADSLLRGNIAIADVPFTTIARPSIRAELVAEVVGPMRIRSVVGRYEDAYERNGVRHTVQVAVQNVEIDVRIINGTAQSVTVDDLLVTAATTLDLPCPPASNLCRSSFRTYPTTEPPASGDLLTVLEIRPAQVGTLGPGQVSEIVTVTFRVDDYVLDGLRGLFGGSGLITPDLTYSIRTAAGPVPAHSRPSARVSLPGGRMADLTLEMTAVAGMPLLPGGVVTYSLVVRNDGPTTATAVSVAAAVPAGTTFTGFDGQDWRCRLTSEAVIVCDSIASIPPGATGEPLSLALRIDAVSLSTVTLTATARAAQVDEDFSNNLASVVTPVGAVVGPGADIGLTGFATEASYEPPFPDYLVTFDVENRGPATAVGVVLSFRLEDTALRFAVPLPCEQRPSDALLVCPLGDIPAGERIPVALRLVSMRPGEQPVSVSVGAVTPDPDPTGRAGGAPNAATVRVIYDITLP